MFQCGGDDRGWMASSAEQAHKVIDVLAGKIDASAFLTWMMDNAPELVSGATTLVNQCVVGA